MRWSRPRTEKPHPVDVLVGSRVRLRRTMLGLTQKELAEVLRISLPQFAKYERSVDRIAASRLYQLSRALDVPVWFFFEAVDPVRAPAFASGSSGAQASEPDLMDLPETADLVEAYLAIEDVNVQHGLVILARALADALGCS